MTQLGFEIVHKFRGSGKVAEAEDWIRANLKGLWALEFLGVQEEIDEGRKTVTPVFHVRFRFGRSEDLARFRDEYIAGKPPRRPATAAQAKARKKKGLLAWLFSD